MFLEEVFMASLYALYEKRLLRHEAEAGACLRCLFTCFARQPSILIVFPRFLLSHEIQQGFPTHSLFAVRKPFHGAQVVATFGIRRGTSFSLSEEDLCDGRQSEQVCYTASLWYAKENSIEMTMVCGIDRQFDPHRVVRKKHDFTDKATRL